jgi:hypothetical protein
MAPRFSILLPTRNRPGLLPLAIASVLAQTAPDFELLVVGDGCTDDTAAVVAGFHDTRIRWFDLPKAHGFGYANRNVALRQATGTYIAFVADDDLVFPDHLERLAASLEESGAEWTYARPLWVTTDGIVVPFASNLLNADELETFLTVGNHIPASCVMYRRSCLAAYGYWPEDVPSGGDWRYWIRIIEGGKRSNIAYSPIPTALHFNAIWKTHANQQMPQVMEARAIAASDWWPSALRVPITSGVPEQHMFSDLISSPGRVDRLRSGVTRVVERLAWMRLNETPDLEARLHADVARSKAELEQARLALADAEDRRAAEELAATSRVRDAETQLGVVLTSTSWRLTAPLRAVSGMIRRVLR